MSQLENVKLILGIGQIDTSQDALIDYYLDVAKQDILNVRYPFGTDSVSLESRYLPLQVELAVIKYSMRGVEGQTEHEENGIRRKYNNILLSSVVPFVKVLHEDLWEE